MPNPTLKMSSINRSMSKLLNLPYVMIQIMLLNALTLTSLAYAASAAQKGMSHGPLKYLNWNPLAAERLSHAHDVGKRSLEVIGNAYYPADNTDDTFGRFDDFEDDPDDVPYEYVNNVDSADVVKEPFGGAQKWWQRTPPPSKESDAEYGFTRFGKRRKKRYAGTASQSFDDYGHFRFGKRKRRSIDLGKSNGPNLGLEKRNVIHGKSTRNNVNALFRNERGEDLGNTFTKSAQSALRSKIKQVAMPVGHHLVKLSKNEAAALPKDPSELTKHLVAKRALYISPRTLHNLFSMRGGGLGNKRALGIGKRPMPIFKPEHMDYEQLIEGEMMGKRERKNADMYPLSENSGHFVGSAAYLHSLPGANANKRWPSSSGLLSSHVYSLGSDHHYPLGGGAIHAGALSMDAKRRLELQGADSKDYGFLRFGRQRGMDFDE